MFCRFCGYELENEANVCPGCGKPVSNGNGWKIAVIAISAVILVAVLVVAVLFGTGVIGGKEDKATEEPTVETTAPSDAPENSYSVDDATAASKVGDIVATVGDHSLTNSELQLHYWYAVYNFLSQYSYYLSAVGLDVNLGLDEQSCYFDTTMTWQEYFLEQALESWKSYAVLCELGEEEDFTLDEEGKEYIENLRATIETDAKNYGYESVEKMLLAEAGPGCDMDGFVSYRELMYVAMQYFAVKYEEMTPTEDEIVAYFDENAATFEESGVTKDSGKYGDVRHILIGVEGGTTDENGNTTYSDEEWATCLAEAERVYQLWKDGEATEESFIALVEEHTDDTASISTGGLYEDIAEGSNYVEEFEAWAIDPARQVGDTELVKTTFGYHFMYYVGGEDIWYVTASKQLLDERFAEFINAGLEAYPMEVSYDKIAIGEISLTGE